MNASQTAVQFETYEPDEIICTVRDMTPPRIGDEVYINRRGRFVVTHVVWAVSIYGESAYNDTVSIVCEQREAAA